ncbi:MAG: hypothetical protein R3E13_03585 [Alphaproteobacteria bacterium]
MAELKAALANLLQRHQEIKANPDISWPQRWPVETQVPKPLLVAGDDGRRVNVATFKDEGGQKYLLFEDPERAGGVVAVPAVDAYQQAADAIEEYRSHLRRGFLPQYNDLDEAGQAERKALVGRMNVVMHSADAAFKDGDVSLQGALAEIEGLMNVRVVRYGAPESELEFALSPVSEPDGTVVERAREAEPEPTPKSDIKPELEEKPEAEPFVAAEKPKNNLINRGPDGRAITPKSDTVDVTQASPSSDSPPPVEQEVVVDEAALNDYLQQAVLNIERTLDGIATMREGFAEAGVAETCGDSFSKKVLIGAVYVMRSHFPDAVGETGMIDVARLPVQGNEKIFDVIKRYNAENAAMAQKPSLEALEAACEAGDSQLQPNNAPTFPANS